MFTIFGGCVDILPLYYSGKSGHQIIVLQYFYHSYFIIIYDCIITLKRYNSKIVH